MTIFQLQQETFFDPEYPGVQEADEKSWQHENVPEELGLLTLQNTILFPGVVLPITAVRDKAIALVKQAYKTNDKLIGVIAQKHIQIEDPNDDDLFRVGTMAKILKMIRMPDGSVTIVLQGRSKFEVLEFTGKEPFYKAKVQKVTEKSTDEDESRALMYNLKEEAFQIIDLSPNIPSEAKIALENISSLGFLINFISSNLSIEVKEKQKILELDNQPAKAEIVLAYLANELNVLELSEEIQTKVRTDLDQQQREYILRQQIRTIQDELGESTFESEIEELRAKAEKKIWPLEVAKVFQKELTKLSRATPSTPEYGIITNYLDWLLELPWGEYSEDHFDFKAAQKILDDDHYGLEKVKERILEYLAVLKLKENKKAPILCFYGPPGVGKTSLGKSIAKAMGREFVRISLGGARDEAEIRGHRRTYIGALPGRIVQGLKKASTSNPVFMLDEIDKVGNDFRGDPASALLEVLDPEQNDTFRDNFLEVEYDLSRVMFIATANSLGTVHPALRDRMEIIPINGYSLEEKTEIARRYLIPKNRKEHGLKASNLKISKKALNLVIDHYTRESGVRKLNQQLAALSRSVAKEIVLNEVAGISVTEKNLSDFLGIKLFEKEIYSKSSTPGVAVGLAWTAVGGEILFVESILSKGKGKLSMTGQLGNVMKESGALAYAYLRSNCDLLGIPFSVFENWDVHLHVPAGATPKDGPSAGITILTSLASLFTQKLIKPSLAMTGEITLRGKVLPVGGIKEKVLAAKRAGIQTIIMSKENKKDIVDIKEEYIKDLSIIFVDEMLEVLEHALDAKPTKNARKLVAEEPSKDSSRIKQIA